jgi:hypothetical protein
MQANMTNLEDQILRVIAARAAKNVVTLVGQYCKAEAEEKEAILAGIEFERWLAETCGECLAGSEDR